MEMKNPKLTYTKEGKTISSELDEKTLNAILQSVLLAKPELSEYDAIKYLFYGLTPIPTNSITYFEFSYIDDMGFKCTIEKAKVKANNNNSETTIKRETEMKNKMTLEQFADLINSSDEWKLEFDDIIVANDWTPIFDEWHICKDGKNVIYFDDNGQAQVKPIEE